ncbi:MAG: hypothetical protein IKP69_08825 [Oscillospiraceae bacterium]|nr:hypothetical protein [Oscillospiraceae bacterium]
MNNHKKFTKKIGVVIALLTFIPTTLVVSAILYYSNQAINPFHEGKANIQIKENNGSFQDTAENDMQWQKEKIDETTYYYCDKLVTLTSQYDDQNLRLMLIPSWWKNKTENGVNSSFSVAGLANSKYTDFSYIKLNRSISELTLDVYTANDTLILSFLLNQQAFEKNWGIPAGEKIALNSFYLHYIGSEQLKTSQKTAPLITAVRIPENVYQTMYPDYELHIDVLADAIEKYGDAVDNRNFNRN